MKSWAAFFILRSCPWLCSRVSALNVKLTKEVETKQRWGILVFLLNMIFQANSLDLRNEHWHIALDPVNLAVQLRLPYSTSAFVWASRGGNNHTLDAPPRYQDHQWHWSWEHGQWQLTAYLAQNDLFIEVRARHPESILLITQPPPWQSKGLILPYGEGLYLPQPLSPTLQKQWQLFLGHKPWDTTQSLSLPLWTMEYPNFTLSWILMEAFDNHLQWKHNLIGTGLSLVHHFTPLNIDRPMRFMLHKGPPHPLGGALRYRRWLQEEGQFMSLEQKMAQTPAIEKLKGASHVYLWGKSPLSTENVKDWTGFIFALQNRSEEWVNAVWKVFTSEAKEQFVQIHKQALNGIDDYHRHLLVDIMNSALLTVARNSWEKDAHSSQKIVMAYAEILQGLERHFAHVLAPSSQWGSGVSTRMMETLAKANLSSLWIGTDSWEAGLLHPDAILAAVRKGWLIGSYDSYETALEEGENSAWVTAHMGADVYSACAIQQANKTKIKGFLGKGVYTNPACIRPRLEDRIHTLCNSIPSNSLFLDSYSAGMLFEDFNPLYQRSQAQMASDMNAVMAKLGALFPLGSESGHAVTSAGIAFAHGPETPVFGWDDEEMHNPVSQYYVGRYWPDDEPDVFFKPIVLKPLFKAVLFNPLFRLPLYQAVFHDSIVSSHHWHTDILKLKEMVKERTLLQALYNTAPLYHLSLSTLPRRMPLMQDYDAFFQPVHRHLFSQPLTDFRWLSPDHLLQSTTFANKSRIVVNFSEQSRLIPSDFPCSLPFDYREEHFPCSYSSCCIPAQTAIAVLSDGSVYAYEAKAAFSQLKKEK